MTSFPYPDLDPDKEAQYRVFPINLTRMLLHTRGQTLPFLKFAFSFREASVRPETRERVIIRVGAITDCRYEVLQHEPEALRTGTSEELLADLLDPGRGEFGDPALTALIAYVDSLVHDLGARPETLDEVRKHFSDGEVAEIALLTGVYLQCAIFLKTFQVPLDERPADWAAADKSLAEVRL